MLSATIHYRDAPETAWGEPAWQARSERRSVEKASTVRDVGRAPHDVVVQDLSASGCSFDAAITVPVGTLVHVGLSGAGSVPARVVWRRDGRHGCAFLSPLLPREMADAFAAESVARFPDLSGLPVAEALREDHPLWPGPARVLIHVGLAAAAWTVVIGIARLAG